MWLTYLKATKIKIEAEGSAEVKLAGRSFTIKKQFIDDLKGTEILDGVKNFKKALLVMHSPIDDTVSVDHASEIFRAAKHPKSFVSLDNADHLLMKGEDARYAAEVLSAWVGRYLDLNEVPKVPLDTGDVVVKSREGTKFTQDIYTIEHHVVADEPMALNGNGQGMTPYDFLLAGLGACTSMTMRMYADHKGFPLERAEVTLTHDKIHAEDCESCEPQSGKIDRIQKNITLHGDLTPEQREKIYAIAEKCPVNRTLLSEILIESKHD